MIDDECSNRARLACNGFFLAKERLGDWGRAHEREGVRKVVMWLRTFVWIFVLFDRGAGCLPNEAQKKPQGAAQVFGVKALN